MWIESLEKIIKEKKSYKEKVNIGASKEEISRVASEIEHKLSIKLPEEYLEIISNINGVEFNGFILYGIDEELLKSEVNEEIYGIIALNEIWYENKEQRKYLFLGESNISWYVYEIESEKYIELDNPSGEEVDTFDNCYELFDKILIDASLEES